MSKIKSFKEFLNEFEIDGEYQQGKPIWNGKDYLDGDGDINLTYMNLTELPCIFPEVWEKSFYCNDNQLTSIEGAPKIIGGSFICSYNKLTSLKGSPEKIKHSFYCNNNELTSLKGGPKEVKYEYYCSNNQLTSLEGAPRMVIGKFDCHNNKVKFTKEDVLKVTKAESKIIV